MWIKCLLYIVLLNSVTFIFALEKQFSSYKQATPPDSVANAWVDSVYNSLNREERFGQLFMVAAFSNKPGKHESQIEDLIKKNSIGGIIFFQGGPVRQALLTNQYQRLSKTPLFIGMDAEWGLGMRLDKDSVLNFPKQMTLGAIKDDEYIFRMGQEIARQCKRMGVHINFAPVADINSNPSNPVIGMRSFGEDKKQVTAKALAYARGMQESGIIPSAKHFPGHGDTGTDSHFTLPIITDDKYKIDSINLYPFKQLINDSIMSIMVAHIFVPAYDSTPNRASTLSPAIVNDLLKKDLSFKGLVFTDALNMKGVSSFYKPGEVEVLALIAGNDVLLYSEDVPTAIKKINKAIKDDLISEEELSIKIKKILRAKYWAGLYKKQEIKIEELYYDLNNNKAQALQLALYGKALTLVKNKNKLLPLQMLDTVSLASISIGLDIGNPFQQMIDNYTPATHFSIPKNPSVTTIDSIIEQLKKFEIVIVGIHNTNAFNTIDYGISENTRILIETLNRRTKAIICVFGNPYSLKFFNSANYLICGYEDNSSTQRLIPQILFGGISAQGRLPVTVDSMFTIGHGMQTSLNVSRLSYAFPENARMDSKTLLHIDTIVNNAIEENATPGCQVLVAKDGMVVFQKSYGHLSYDKLQPVTSSTIYDIASISKVAGTLQAVMFLEERGLINIEKKASYYLTDLKHTNKEDILVKDILCHQAGLVPFIPYWKRTLDTTGFMKSYYCTVEGDTFCRQVVPGLYTSLAIEDSLWKWSVESELLKLPKRQKHYDYVYSDIGFYIMKRIVEKIINQPMDQFLQQNFYDPLGLATMTYKPLYKFPPERIAPTEEDKAFRKSMIRGTVHDPGAALMGGVAGHAGLFSNANDLAILMQMNLNLGIYGGVRYLMSSTIEDFTDVQFEKNRRGLGWDKPEPLGNGPTSTYASSNTFGHTGFTGTATWVDPDHSLVYVFLSNRVHPDPANTKLTKHNVRTKIQDYIYKSIINYED